MVVHERRNGHNRHEPRPEQKRHGDDADHVCERLAPSVRYREHPIMGVQFHPESVLTPVGHDVVRNFLAAID